MIDNRMQYAEIIPTHRKTLYLILSFLLPVVVMGAVFAFNKIYPFGDRQILIVDFWHQYYPLISDFWHKLREGVSLLWSWTFSGDYLGNIAYYMTSPLNLLAVLAPHEWLRESLTLALIIKLGFAGLFFSLYMYYAHGKFGLQLPFFALLYALCAFAQGYYWNIMWIDTFAMLPLVILGVHALFTEGKFLLYTISLALSVFFNYFIGFFICIFVAITFFSLCVIHRTNREEFLRKFVLIAVCSGIALGLTAFLTFPAYSSLQSTHSINSAFPSDVKFFRSAADILGNMIAFTPASSIDGLPNLYCGMISVMLAAVFVCSPKISLREKVVYLYIAIFMILSCNINVLDYIWHGFHYTSMVPFRFSFLSSFTLVAMAYRAYTLIDEMNWMDLLIMAVSAVLFLFMAKIGPQEDVYVIYSAALSAVYLLIFTFSIGRQGFSRKLLNIALIVAVLAEVSVTSYISVKKAGTTERASYPDQYEKVMQVLDMRQSADSDFYRTELTEWYTVNSASVYGFKGFSLFSSSVSASVTGFAEGIGLPGWEAGNRYVYAETSPLTNAFLNMRYLISRNNSAADGEVFWKNAGSSGNVILLENNRYLPLGFMVGEETAGYAHDDNNLFRSQNDLFQRATGLDGDLFTSVDVDHVTVENCVIVSEDLNNYSYTINESSDKGSVRWNYKIPDESMLYGYCRVDNSDNAWVSNIIGTSRFVNIQRPYIFTVGRFTPDKPVFIVGSLDAAKSRQGRALVYMYRLDRELFDRGYALLADETLTLTKFSETEVAGTVTALRDGLLYTSIPFENRWKVFVDGVESDIVVIDGCMSAVRLSKGHHTVEFRYYNKSFTIGTIVSTTSFIALGALIILDIRRRRKLLSQPEQTEAA